MNEKFNKNAKVEQLSKMFLSLGEEKGLIVKDPLLLGIQGLHCLLENIFGTLQAIKMIFSYQLLQSKLSSDIWFKMSFIACNKI